MSQKKIRLIIIAILFIILNVIVFQNKEKPYLSNFNYDLKLPEILNEDKDETYPIYINSDNDLAVNIPVCDTLDSSKTLSYTLKSTEEGVEYLSTIQKGYFTIAATKKFNNTQIMKTWTIKIQQTDCAI